MSTYFPSGDGLADNRKWYVVDAAGQTVGRLATEVARVLTGKNKPQYTPFMDMGDCVIVINARKAVFKGSKNEQKVYRHHTDRKSTRLNSSHRCISYAVFCLKQKNDGHAQRRIHLPVEGD